jgi:hypothetical protein
MVLSTLLLAMALGCNAAVQLSAVRGSPVSLPPTLALSRRAALLAAAALVGSRPQSARAAATEDRLESALARLDGLLKNWDLVTIDCTYAEVPRELLESKNKEKLLKQATQNALFDKSASINVCKSTDRVVRRELGTTADGPLSRFDRVLQSPTILSTVDPDRADEFIALSEKLQQALGAADAAAFTSETGDFSARTPFQVGEAPTAPNLETARLNIKEARELLQALMAMR